MLLVNISWNTKLVTTFALAHSGQVPTNGYPTGVPAPPAYDTVQVSGVPAYWQVVPAPGPTNPTAPSSDASQTIGASKSGYVVQLTSQSFSRSQVEHALSAVLARL